MNTEPFASDFIVISEFSEKEGPVPRYVIGLTPNNFPLDKFVLKLMSVDLQIEFNEKWTVWYQWTKYKIESLSIYINLKDIYARGYSRFIAISYVTDYRRKIFQNKDIFINYLSKIADILLKSNIKIFNDDIKRSLNDISTIIRIHDLNRIDNNNSLLIDESKRILKNKIDHLIHSDDLKLPKYDSLNDLFNDLKSILIKIDHHNNNFTISYDKIDSYLIDNINNLNTIDQILNVRELQFKSSLYDKNLRSIEELTSPIFIKCYDKLESFLKRARHDPFIIQYIKHERNQIFNAHHSSEPLSIGGVPMMNMNNRVFKNEDKGFKLNLSSNSEYFGGYNYDNYDLMSICTILWPSLPYQSYDMNMLDDRFSKKMDNNDEDGGHLKTSNSFDLAIDIKADDTTSTTEENFFLNHGYTLLDMSRHLSFTRHIIFSLLKGRTVIIYSDSKYRKAVEKTIESLRVFVPGNYLNKNHRIIPWLDDSNHHLLINPSSIGLEILSFCKLIGIDKSYSIPQQVKRNVSLWEWESETFNAPCYENGLFIDMIINPKKKWPNDISYRAYIHYVLFNEFAMKAYIFYHMIWIGLKISISTNDQKSSINKKKAKIKNIDQIYEYRHKIKSEFFKGLNIMENDAEIIEYLVEIIKESKSQLKNESFKNRIKLDFSKTKLFNRVSF